MLEHSSHRPSPIPEPQHAPHEGGNGAPGLPPTIHERAKPPPESLVYEDWQSTSGQEPQPESQEEPTPAKRPRGRPRLPIPPEDRERLLKRGRNDRYQQKHGDKKLERNKRYQKEHSEERNQYRRDYYVRRPQAQYMREYRKQKREQSEAELKQTQQDQHTEATHIFP
jgi:hypothetical protein